MARPLPACSRGRTTRPEGTVIVSLRVDSLHMRVYYWQG